LGTWVVNVDADEFLVFSGMEEHSLADVQTHLNARGQTRMLTPMIDMYAGPNADDVSRGTVFEQAPFFDGGLVHGAPSYRVRDSKLGAALFGGPRARMMREIGCGDDIQLRKVAVAWWDHTTAYANTHYPFPFEESPQEAQGALLHFKFLPGFAQKVDEAIADGEHWSDATHYRLYQVWLENHDRAALYNPEWSRRYEGPKSLVDANLMVPLEWSEA
jgi:hypothetical protein